MSTIKIRAAVAVDAQGRYVVYGTSSDTSDGVNDDFGQAHEILQSMRCAYEIAPGMTSYHRTPPPGLIGGCTIEAEVPVPEMGTVQAQVPKGPPETPQEQRLEEIRARVASVIEGPHSGIKNVNLMVIQNDNLVDLAKILHVDVPYLMSQIPLRPEEVQESPSVRSAAQEASQGPSRPEPATAGPKPDDAGLSPRHEHQVMAGHDGDSSPTLKGNLDSPTNLKNVLEQTPRMKDPNEL